MFAYGGGLISFAHIRKAVMDGPSITQCFNPLVRARGRRRRCCLRSGAVDMVEDARFYGRYRGRGIADEARRQFPRKSRSDIALVFNESKGPAGRTAPENSPPPYRA